jgi:hypothetical protein
MTIVHKGTFLAFSQVRHLTALCTTTLQKLCTASSTWLHSQPQNTPLTHSPLHSRHALPSPPAPQAAPPLPNTSTRNAGRSSTRACTTSPAGSASAPGASRSHAPGRTPETGSGAVCEIPRLKWRVELCADGTAAHGRSVRDIAMTRRRHGRKRGGRIREGRIAHWRRPWLGRGLVG